MEKKKKKKKILHLLLLSAPRTRDPPSPLFLVLFLVLPSLPTFSFLVYFLFFSDTSWVGGDERGRVETSRNDASMDVALTTFLFCISPPPILERPKPWDQGLSSRVSFLWLHACISRHSKARMQPRKRSKLKGPMGKDEQTQKERKRKKRQGKTNRRLALD